MTFLWYWFFLALPLPWLIRWVLPASPDAGGSILISPIAAEFFALPTARASGWIVLVATVVQFTPSVDRRMAGLTTVLLVLALAPYNRTAIGEVPALAWMLAGGLAWARSLEDPRLRWPLLALPLLLRPFHEEPLKLIQMIHLDSHQK